MRTGMKFSADKKIYSSRLIIDITIKKIKMIIICPGKKTHNVYTVNRCG